MKSLKAISDNKDIFRNLREVGEDLANISGTVAIIGSCLLLNDEFKDFKKCVEESKDILRHHEEMYGFPEEKE